MDTTSNPLTEISVLIITGLLIIAGTVLLYFGKVDFTGATLMFGTAAGIFGVQGAFKAPSPSQQAQLSTQHQSLQQLLSQVFAVLPGLLQSQQPQVVVTQPQQAAPIAQAPTTPAPVAPTLPGPAPQFVSPVSMPVVRDSAIMAAFPVPPQQ